MKPKKIPMRTCVVTHERCKKKDLIRIVKTPFNEVIIDESGKVNGHGAYLKKDKSVVDKAKKSKVLEKYLETQINDELYDKLLEIVK